MRKFLLSAAAVAMLFSCRKDSKQQTIYPESAFSAGNKQYPTTHALLENNGDDLGDLWLSNTPITATTNGRVHVVRFEIDTLIAGGTYTLVDATSGNFNRKQHFADAIVIYEAMVNNGVMDPTKRVILADIRNGILRVNKQGDDYILDYEVAFESGEKVKGYYKGKLVISE